MASKKRPSPADEDKPELVATERASRGTWLVKVPRYLSERWQSADNSSIVGRFVRTETGAFFESEQLKLQPQQDATSISSSQTQSASGKKQNLIDDPQPIGKRSNRDEQTATQSQPHAFCTKKLVSQTMAILCEDKSALEENAEFNTGKLSIEGMVTSKAEIQPPRTSTYMRMKAEQIRLVSQPKRIVKHMDRAVVKYTPTDNHVEHKAKEKSKKEAQKDRAVRLEKSDVTDLIFSAFEKHQFYRFSDLQRITSQPATLVKEILTEVAIYNTQLPHKYTWELKPEYRNYSQKIAQSVEKQMASIKSEKQSKSGGGNGGSSKK